MTNYGPDGTCGTQHNNTFCLPPPPGQFNCCSISGFCGSNTTYCFQSLGCQSQCVDPSVYYASSTATPTSASTVTSTATSTSTATQTSTPAPAAVLSAGQKTGIIVGSILFALAALGIILFFLYKRRTSRPGVTPPGNQMVVYTREANGTVETLSFPQEFARQNPGMVPSYGHRGRRAIGGLGTPATNRQYLNDIDDWRIENLGSDV